MLNDFVSLLFPRCCLISNAPLARGERYVSVAAGQALPRFDQQRLPEALRQQLYTFAPVRHALAYYKFARHGGVQQLLHHLKYKNCPEVGEVAGMWFAHAIVDAGLKDAFDTIVPVPLHASKQRRRGYNQCDYVAKGMANVLEIPWIQDSLVKVRHTQSQTRKSRWERSENVLQGFALRNADAVRGRRILLVDDVMTTGATLGEGAKALLEGGVQEVSVAALAAGQ
jgi:ComF family protein